MKFSKFGCKVTKKKAHKQKKSRKVDFRRDFYKIGAIIILVVPEVYYILLVA
jgi:hypothetical protein